MTWMKKSEIFSSYKERMALARMEDVLGNVSSHGSTAPSRWVNVDGNFAREKYVK